MFMIAPNKVKTLVLAVHCAPELFNRSHKDYGKTFKTSPIWEQIAKVTDMENGNAAKLLWKKLYEWYFARRHNDLIKVLRLYYTDSWLSNIPKRHVNEAYFKYFVDMFFLEPHYPEFMIILYKLASPLVSCVFKMSLEYYKRDWEEDEKCIGIEPPYPPDLVIPPRGGDVPVQVITNFVVATLCCDIPSPLTHVLPPWRAKLVVEVQPDHIHLGTFRIDIDDFIDDEEFMVDLMLNLEYTKNVTSYGTKNCDKFDYYVEQMFKVLSDNAPDGKMQEKGDI